MNPLQRALIEKTSHGFSFEYVLAESFDMVTLASARQPVQVQVSMFGVNYLVEVVNGSDLLRLELTRDFESDENSAFKCINPGHLASFIKRAASLERSLTNTVQQEYDQKAVIELQQLLESIREANIVSRILELTYTVHDINPWAKDLGYNGKPFALNSERRAMLRAELDAYYAKLHGLARNELRYILNSADAMDEDYPDGTFRVLKINQINQFGDYRTQRLVLDAWEKLENGELTI